MKANIEKEVIEKEFKQLFNIAKEQNPDFDLTMLTLNNMIAQTDSIQDYLNLTTQTPAESSNNQITFQ